MSSGRSKSLTDGDMQVIPAPEKPKPALPPLPPDAGSKALVEYAAPAPLEEEDLEVKLRRIIDHVPVRVSNTSGSSAGSGSGDFHQVYAQLFQRIKTLDWNSLSKLFNLVFLKYCWLIQFFNPIISTGFWENTGRVEKFKLWILFFINLEIEN